MGLKVISGAVPGEVIEAVDAIVGDEPGARSRFVRRAVERAIKERERKRQRRAATSEQEVAA